MFLHMRRYLLAKDFTGERGSGGQRLRVGVRVLIAAKDIATLTRCE